MFAGTEIDNFSYNGNGDRKSFPMSNFQLSSLVLTQQLASPGNLKPQTNHPTVQQHGPAQPTARWATATLCGSILSDILLQLSSPKPFALAELKPLRRLPFPHPLLVSRPPQATPCRLVLSTAESSPGWKVSAASTARSGWRTFSSVWFGSLRVRSIQVREGICCFSSVLPGDWLWAEMLVLFETPAGFALLKVLDEGKLDKVEVSHRRCNSFGFVKFGLLRAFMLNYQW